MEIYIVVGLISVAVIFAILWAVDHAAVKSQETFWRDEAGKYAKQAKYAEAEAGYHLSCLSEVSGKLATVEADLEAFTQNYRREVEGRRQLRQELGKTQQGLEDSRSTLKLMTDERDGLRSQLVTEQAVLAALGRGLSRVYAMETGKMANIGKRMIRTLRRAQQEAIAARNGVDPYD